MSPKAQVAYVTRYGSSRRVAEHAAGVLRDAGFDVTLTDLRQDPSRIADAELLVAVGAVYSNQHDDALVAALKAWGADVADVTTWLLSVSLAAALGTDEGEAMTLDYGDNLFEATGWIPTRVAFVAGALDASQYDAATRALLAVARWRGALDADGDVVFTDLDALTSTLQRWLKRRR